MSRRRRDGPRQAVRWIGDAFVLEGDLRAGAPAVWRGGREPQCARVCISEMMRDWEFAVDEAPLVAAAVALAGPGIVPRYATYARDDDVVVVEVDVADLSLRDLITAASPPGASTEAPVGLVLYVLRELVRACEMAGDVPLDLHPARIAVAWDGRVLLRPLTQHEELDDLVAWRDDPVDAAAYFTPPAEPRLEQQLVAGALAYELATGRHPFKPAAAAADDERDDDDDDEDDDEDDDDDDEEAYVAGMRARMDAGEHERIVGAPALATVIERFIGRAFASWAAAAAAVDDALADEPFDARSLAGMLRGLFEDTHAACALEREDRLQVMPGPRVELEPWAPLDPESVEGDTNGYEVVDLDDVREGRGGFDEPYEPAVEPVDPFDDD